MAQLQRTVWLLLVSLLTALDACSAQDDTLDVVTDPTSEGVTEDSVTLKCTYHLPSYYQKEVIISWYFDPTDGGEKSIIMTKTDEENPIYYGRASGRLEHVGTRGDLKINRLELLDDGVYTCDVNFYLAKERGSGTTKLDVFHFVDFVDILQYNQGDYVWAPAGDEVSFDCKATRAKPESILTWYKNNAVMDDGVSHTTSKNSDGTYNTESSVILTPTLQDHNAIIKCESKQDTRLLQGQRKDDAVVLNTSGVVINTGNFVLMALTIFLHHVIQ